MVRAVLFGWFADFRKTLTLINDHPNRFILTNGKHPLCLGHELFLRVLFVTQAFSKVGTSKLPQPDKLLS